MKTKMRFSLAKGWLATLAAPGFLLVSHPARATTWTPLDDPDALRVNGQSYTYALGFSGSNVVGYYLDPSDHPHGFLYDGHNYATLDEPLEKNSFSFPIYSGISGPNIVGAYGDINTGTVRGFLYNGSTYTPMDAPYPNVSQTYARGIQGSNIVGYYYRNDNTGHDANAGNHGFLYDGSTYTSLEDPFAVDINGTYTGTFAIGISGSSIVGMYLDDHDSYQGFLYNINSHSYTTLSDPLAGGQEQGTHALGTDGSSVVGYYDETGNSHDHGFLYDGSSYTTLDNPNAGATYIYGISGSTIVGFYSDHTGDHGFVTNISVPEPSGLAMLGLGIPALLGFQRRRRVHPASGQ